MNSQLGSQNSKLLCCSHLLQATKYEGKLYIATNELFGAKASRTPSIYWAIVDPSHKLCKPSVEDWGVVPGTGPSAVDEQGS